MAESLIYLYLPVTIVVACNVIIVNRLRQTSKFKVVCTLNQGVLEKRYRKQKQKQITYLLLTVAGAFLLLHFPQVLAKVCQALYPSQFKILQRV